MDDKICDLMEKGIKSLALNQFKESLSYFDEILEIDEDNLAALNNKGLSLNGLGKFDEALDCFDKILDMDDKFYFSLMGKAETLYYLEYYESAIDYYNRALDIDTNNDLAWYGKSTVFYKIKQYDDALECLNKVKNISKKWLDQRVYDKILKKTKQSKFNHRVAFTDKINKLLSKENYTELLEVSDEALKLFPKSSVFMYNKAYALYNLRKYRASLRCVDVILKFDFMNIDALTVKSKNCVKLNMYDDALACLDTIKKLGGTIDEIFYKEVVSNIDDTPVEDELKDLIRQGNYYLTEEDYDEALCRFDEALELDDENIIALNNKGFTLYLLNSYDEAIKIFNKVLEIQNDYIYSLLGKSYSLYFLNDFRRALDCYNQIIYQNNELCDENYLNLLNDANGI